jgi:hypothetical protein
MLRTVQPSGQEPWSGVAEALRQDRQCLRGLAWTFLPISVLLVVYISSWHDREIRGAQDLVSNSMHQCQFAQDYHLHRNVYELRPRNLAQIGTTTTVCEMPLQNGLHLLRYETCRRS